MSDPAPLRSVRTTSFPHLLHELGASLPVTTFQAGKLGIVRSALAPEDRRHLNGLALEGGRPKYVAALGTTDTAGGWRANQARGGVLPDVDSGAAVLSGLSMPHSPRLDGGRIWLLESGDESIGTVDPTREAYGNLAELPGFPRGLDSCGKVASRPTAGSPTCSTRTTTSSARPTCRRTRRRESSPRL